MTCDRPDVWSRWMLEQTLELLDDAGPAQVLRGVLTTQPLAKPVDHSGGPATDMFVLSLGQAELATVAQRVTAAVLAGRVTAATRDRGLGGFVAAWQEYVRFVERQEGAS